MEWKSLDTPPIKAGYYIVAGAWPEVLCARWLPKKDEWKFSSAQQAFTVRYWMYFPEPPKS